MIKPCLAVLVISTGLAGCETFDKVGLAEEPKPQVNITADTFCRLASEPHADGKRYLIVSYEPGDTPGTATKIEQLGATYEKVCPEFVKKGSVPEHVPLK
jgi:hypothetical protein